MHTVSVRLKFCAAHRVLGHAGKCRHLHGHNYTATVVLTPTDRVVTKKVKVGKKGTKEVEETIPAGLDDLGMVIDFATVKDKVREWVDENLDHNTILKDGDPLIEAINEDQVEGGDQAEDQKEVYVMSGGRNATAECLAEELSEKVTELLLDEFVRVVSVTVEETDGCSATFTPDGSGSDGDGDGDGESEDSDEDDDSDEEDDTEDDNSDDDGDDDEEDEEDEEEDEDEKPSKKDKKKAAQTDDEDDDDPVVKKLKPR